MKIEFRKHNIEFEKLQSEYLAEKNPKTLSKMYEIAYKYCCHLLLQFVHEKNFNWEDETITEKAHDCATWLIEPYLRRQDFKIEKLSSYAHFAKLKILYAHKAEETKEVSLDEFIEKHGERWKEELLAQCNF